MPTEPSRMQVNEYSCLKAVFDFCDQSATFIILQLQFLSNRIQRDLLVFAGLL